MMMMTSAAKNYSKISLIFPLLLLILILLFEATSSAVVSTTKSSSGAPIRKPFAAARRNNNRGAAAFPDCGEIRSRSECTLNHPRCKWCRSQSIDDFCFSKSEAWRLPSQVFTCD